MMTALTARRPPPLFSIGVILRHWWRPSSALAPFACAAALLTALSMWDFVAASGPVDFVVLGLAGYELILGLTE
jgi:hypothetical protein